MSAEAFDSELEELAELYAFRAYEMFGGASGSASAAMRLRRDHSGAESPVARVRSSAGEGGWRAVWDDFRNWIIRAA
jgi:hypothetical protein